MNTVLLCVIVAVLSATAAVAVYVTVKKIVLKGQKEEIIKQAELEGEKIKNDKEKMTQLIRNERRLELCFENKRFWDLRRWKEAPQEYQKGIYGFHITSASPEDYYVKTFVAEQNFGLKDYFWPVPTSYIEVNPNLVQNIGW